MHEGQTIKNYKALCAELEMEIKRDNSKKAQIKELERYIAYHKEGHQIIIDEIYDEPLPKEDGRGKSEGSRNNNTVFSDTIKTLLLHMLASKNNHQIKKTKNRILMDMHAINSNFSFCSEYVKATAEHLNIDRHIVYDYFSTTRNMLHQKLNTALNQLSKKSLIHYQQIIMVYDGSHREATTEEVKNILELERELLDEMGFEEINHVRESAKWKKFKEQIENRVQRHVGVTFYYQAYDIIISEKYIEREYQKMLDWILEEEEVNEYLIFLNNTVREKLIINAKKRKRKKGGKMEKTRRRFDYENKMNDLVAGTIPQHSRDIANEIRYKYLNDEDDV
ncbi:hypothetical protein [Salibacterium qingdaonense]|uniref:hypothetical protein n=1 Tax=Salibacterium qingdaonense TaxID=266892 RepID=UPI0011601C29|nr:hypothetical protein [Salibacterium qingdaonense]